MQISDRRGLVDPNLLTPWQKLATVPPLVIEMSPRFDASGNPGRILKFRANSPWADLDFLEIQAHPGGSKLWFELKQPSHRPLHSQAEFDAAIEDVARRLGLQGELLRPRKEWTTRRSNVHLHLSVTSSKQSLLPPVSLAWNYRRLKLLRLAELGTISSKQLLFSMYGYYVPMSGKGFVHYVSRGHFEDLEITLDVRQEAAELMGWMKMPPSQANAEINLAIEELGKKIKWKKLTSAAPSLLADFFDMDFVDSSMVPLDSNFSDMCEQVATDPKAYVRKVLQDHKNGQGVNRLPAVVVDSDLWLEEARKLEVDFRGTAPRFDWKTPTAKRFLRETLKRWHARVSSMEIKDTEFGAVQLSEFVTRFDGDTNIKRELTRFARQLPPGDPMIEHILNSLRRRGSDTFIRSIVRHFEMSQLFGSDPVVRSWIAGVGHDYRMALRPGHRQVHYAIEGSAADANPEEIVDRLVGRYHFLDSAFNADLQQPMSRAIGRIQKNEEMRKAIMSREDLPLEVRQAWLGHRTRRQACVADVIGPSAP